MFWLPLYSVVRPSGHDLQEDCPLSSWYVPTEHVIQSPDFEYVPGGQSTSGIYKKNNPRNHEFISNCKVETILKTDIVVIPVSFEYSCFYLIICLFSFTLKSQLVERASSVGLRADFDENLLIHVITFVKANYFDVDINF